MSYVDGLFFHFRPTFLHTTFSKLNSYQKWRKWAIDWRDMLFNPLKNVLPFRRAKNYPGYPNECVESIICLHHSTNLKSIPAFADNQIKGFKSNLLIGDFISNTLPLIQYNIKSTVSVETDISHDTLRIKADLTQMQMVLSAIISNASEAIDSSGFIQITGRNIEITEENSKDFGELKAGPYVCLKIDDDGKGMDEETRKRVFEPFFSTKFTGRGLGMAAAYGIIKNHGGRIAISSEVCKGTTVRFYLPAILEMSEYNARF